MLGTPLATSSIMASNFIGDRLFAYDIKTDVYVEDSQEFYQRHVLNQIGVEIKDVNVSNNTIRQNHIVASLSLKSNSYSQDTTINQAHILINEDIALESNIDTSTIYQAHITQGKNLDILVINDKGTLKQKQFLSSNDIQVYPKLDIVALNQKHNLTSNDQYIQMSILGAVLSQNHKAKGVDLTLNGVSITSPVDIFQLHVISGSNLTLDPVSVGKPYVNPSIRRVVYATGDSTNMMVITVEENNYALLLNPSTNKYS